LLMELTDDGKIGNVSVEDERDTSKRKDHNVRTGQSWQ
jgi:hypothetical protein